MPVLGHAPATAFFYLRVVVMMYMTQREGPSRVPAVPLMAGITLVVSAVIIFYLGILPARVLDLAAASISTIF